MPQLSVLVVEDHADSARALSRLLQQEGYHVVAAMGFADALAVAVRMGPIDVLISDITLTDGNGCTLLRVLSERKSGPPSHAIAVTGHDDARWIDECRRAGFRHYLVKPVTFDAVIAAIVQCPGGSLGDHPTHHT
jgi:CheY-like chemotaxis protein